MVSGGGEAMVLHKFLSMEGVCGVMLLYRHLHSSFNILQHLSF